MMDFNENWERWCRISINKHFENGRGDTKCFFEGFIRATEDLPDYFEVRVNGPGTRENTKDKWKLNFEVNVLVVVKFGSDAYRINRLTGRATALFLDCIEVRKYGDGSEDDETVIGCLNLLMPAMANEKVQVDHFGQINPPTGILQAAVEGHYTIRFD